jgi:hypothetical protein
VRFIPLIPYFRGSTCAIAFANRPFSTGQARSVAIYRFLTRGTGRVARDLFLAWLALSMPACSGGSNATVVPSNVQAVPSDRLHTAAVSTITVTETPSSADAFVNSFGVVTHFNYFSTPYYTQYSTVRAQLAALGARHIRDTLDAHGSTTFLQRLQDLASLGIRTDAGTVITDTATSIKSSLASIPSGAVEAVEGPNEYDLSGDPNWVSKLRSFAPMMYSAVKSAPSGASYQVFGPSVTSEQAFAALGNLSSYLDYGTMHNYFGTNSPNEYGWLQQFITAGHHVSGTRPLVTSETGYKDAAGQPNYVPPSVKARYSMRELLLQFNAQVYRTYFYELVDEGGESLGFIDSSLHPKPVYTAMENLLQNLRDPGPAFTLKPLNYSLTADSSVAHTLLQKRDGTYRFMCWVEVPQTDPTVPVQSIVFKTATRFSSISQDTWQDDGTVRITTLSQQPDGSISFNVTDRVSEIELR